MAFFVSISRYSLLIVIIFIYNEKFLLIVTSRTVLSKFNHFRGENENIKGIPEFWLTIFKNVGTLAEMVQEHDEPILKHLYDIKVIFLESNPMVRAC